MGVTERLVTVRFAAREVDLLLASIETAFIERTGGRSRVVVVMGRAGTPMPEGSQPAPQLTPPQPAAPSPGIAPSGTDVPPPMAPIREQLRNHMFGVVTVKNAPGGGDWPSVKLLGILDAYFEVEHGGNRMQVPFASIDNAKESRGVLTVTLKRP